MKKLISVALLSLLLVPGLAEAKKGVSNQEIRTLITKIRKRSDAVHKKIRAFSDPLIRYAVAPGTSPEQGQSVTVFATLNSGFTDSETFLADAKFDGASVNLDHPSEGLWIFEAGSFTELLSHTLQATVYIQDAAQAKAIRDAIQSLETQITDLNTQIANATDPDVIAQLTAQRDEKQTLKDSLVAALANLKSPVATEQVSFEVVPATSGTDFPKISSVDPNFGKMDQTNYITINGANFPSDSTLAVIVGGQLANGTVLESNSKIIANIPAFAVGGAKDVEVRFTKDGKTKNAIFHNAYFAGFQSSDPEPLPVANAGANQSLGLGGTATFSGASSYDTKGHALSYSWQVISKPAGSNLIVPTNPPGSDITFAVTPDVPGSYVIALNVSTVSPALTSLPSLTVLEATAPGNRAPTGSAPGITATKNSVRTTQITASDADFWQSRSYFVTKQSAFGSATVSSAGLVSFASTNSPGSDTLEITIVDNGTPPLSTVVSIPVTVLSNTPPVIQSTPVAYQRTGGLPYQVRFALSGVSSGAVTDPDGTIQSLTWDFGDDTHERIFDLAAATATHNYMAPGNYTATLTAVDNGGAVTSVSGPVVVKNGGVPSAKFKYDVRAGTAPLTVTFDASAASGSNGIAVYRWLFNDSSAEQVTTTPSITHTFNAPAGTPVTGFVRLRTRETNGTTGGEGESASSIFINQSDPGPVGVNQPVIGPPRIVTLGSPTTFDGSNSFCSAQGHDVASYNWTFGYFNNGGTGASQSYTYPFALNYFPGLQAFADTTGFSSPRAFVETWAVNAGLPPRAIARFDRTSGVAPLTINVDGSESYDYDGTLSSTGFHWAFEAGSNVDAPTASHTFNTPGVYNVGLAVNDADGNTTQVNTTVTVTSSMAEAVHSQPVKKLDYMDPAEREYMRQVLAGACWQGEQAEACYQLGQMYEEDGDAFTKAKLWEKACGMGYAPACSAVGGRK